jgi:hypothetical protein
MQRHADEQQGADQLGRRPIPGTLRLESEGSGVCLGQGVVDDALFRFGMRAGVVGLVAVAFSNEVGTITTLSKCSSKLAMLTGNGQRTLAVR